MCRRREAPAKEFPVYSEFPAARGCAAMFKGDWPLNMQESENDLFRFPRAERAGGNYSEIS